METLIKINKMGNILQDMMGMLSRKKTVTPKTDDYVAIARYAGAQERMKPHPKVETELITLGSIKTFTNAGLNCLPKTGGTISGNLDVTGTIELSSSGEGIILTSPDGTKFKQTISNAGVPEYTAI